MSYARCLKRRAGVHLNGVDKGFRSAFRQVRVHFVFVGKQQHFKSDKGGYGKPVKGTPQRGVVGVSDEGQWKTSGLSCSNPNSR